MGEGARCHSRVYATYMQQTEMEDLKAAAGGLDEELVSAIGEQLGRHRLCLVLSRSSSVVPVSVTNTIAIPVYNLIPLERAFRCHLQLCC